MRTTEEEAIGASQVMGQRSVVNGSVLAELMAMREEDPQEARRRFHELSPEELNVLSKELGARLITESLNTENGGGR
jgi:hypothetical protein